MSDQRNVERSASGAWHTWLGQHPQVDGEDDRQWPSWVMILGIFVTLMSFWYVSAHTFITYWDLGRVALVLMFAGNLAPGLGARLGLDKRYWAMLNMLGIGPLLFSALLWANFLFTSGHRGYVVVQPTSGIDARRYWVENDRLPDGFDFDLEDQGTFMNAERIRPGDHYLVIARGCLGYDVLVSETTITAWSGPVPGP